MQRYKGTPPLQYAPGCRAIRVHTPSNIVQDAALQGYKPPPICSRMQVARIHPPPPIRSRMQRYYGTPRPPPSNGIYLFLTFSLISYFSFFNFPEAAGIRYLFIFICRRADFLYLFILYWPPGRRYFLNFLNYFNFFGSHFRHNGYKTSYWGV